MDQSQNTQAPPKSLTVTLRNPEKLLFQGYAKGISSVNDKGPFDILYNHENFITLIQQKLVIYPLEGKQVEWAVDQGVLKVIDNIVNIFLGIESV